MQPRQHHYAFTHLFLPKQAHASPDKLLTELSGPLREGFLFFLWEELGKQLGGEKVPAVGLNVAGMDERDGDTYALIAMPAPQAAGETYFAAVVHRPGRTQVFVVDRNVDGTGGVLAKLGPDGSRLSYGACDVDMGSFLARVVDLVREEPNASPSLASSPGVAPTVALAASPVPLSAPGSTATGSVWSQSAPGYQSFGNPGNPASGTPAPVSPSVKPQPRKKSGGKIALGVGGGCLAVVFLMCALTGFAAYDGGSDFEEDPFTVRSTTELDTSGHEQVVLSIGGGPDWASYDISGEGVPAECHYLTEFRPRCVVPLGDSTQRSLQYRVAARGRAASFFDEIRVGSVPTSQQDVRVERPVGLEWSEARHATICRGAPCELRMTGGFLEVREAPGATVRVGGGAPSPSVLLDVGALVDGLGVARVLDAGAAERVAVQGVTITLADGSTITGDAEVPARDLARALVTRLSDLQGANLGPAQGASTLWVEDGRVRQTVGAPARIADIGRLVVATTREASAGRCGPYSVYGFGGDYLSRTRTETTVVVFDRRTNTIESRRTFRAPTPRCPQTIPLSQRTVGTHDTADADAYAREQIALPLPVIAAPAAM